jgi:hypothetical protein
VLKLSSNVSDVFPKFLKLSSEVSECKPLVIGPDCAPRQGWVQCCVMTYEVPPQEQGGRASQTLLATSSKSLSALVS